MSEPNCPRWRLDIDLTRIILSFRGEHPLGLVLLDRKEERNVWPNWNVVQDLPILSPRSQQQGRKMAEIYHFQRKSSDGIGLWARVGRKEGRKRGEGVEPRRGFQLEAILKQVLLLRTYFVTIDIHGKEKVHSWNRGCSTLFYKSRTNKKIEKLGHNILFSSQEKQNQFILRKNTISGGAEVRRCHKGFGEVFAQNSGPASSL